jgi:hypothetical protein
VRRRQRGSALSRQTLQRVTKLACKTHGRAGQGRAAPGQGQGQDGVVNLFVCRMRPQAADCSAAQTAPKFLVASGACCRTLCKRWGVVAQLHSPAIKLMMSIRFWMLLFQ